MSKRSGFKKHLCQAPILTEFVGGKRQCKRKPLLLGGSYCYQHLFLATYTGYYIDRNFKQGKLS